MNAATLSEQTKPDRPHLSDLDTAATWYLVLGGVLGAIGVLSGIVVAIVTEGHDVHPYAGVGLGISAASLVVGSVVVLLALWAKAWVTEARRATER